MTGEIQAILRLKSCRGLGDRSIAEMIRVHGSGAAALRVVKSQGQLFPSAGEELVTPSQSWAENGIRVLPLTDPGYPSSLKELSDPPPLLFLRGRDSLLQGPAVAVVGARRATEVGRETAEALGRILASAGITVVSGLARGIDGAAHRGALSVDGPTLAVLGSGLDVAYPPIHRRLFREMGRRGLLVSEFLPKEPALSHHFPKRNRIIAALARAIVVVEAGERSGALITVDHGLDLGREILAVPGSLRNPQAAGTNALIRDGARLLTSPGAILEELRGLVEEGERRTSRVGSAPSSVEPGDSGLFPSPTDGFCLPLPTELRALWNALEPNPAPLDLIAGAAGMTPAEALAGLSSLELLGRAQRCPGMRFRRE